MNPLFHFLFNYVIMNYLITDTRSHILIIFIASTIVDLDHLPYLLRDLTWLREKSFTLSVRTMFHEFPALIIMLTLLLLSNIWISEEVIMIMSGCLLLHYTIDFLFGETQPFKPLIEEVINLNLTPDARFLFESILTLITGGVVLLLTT